MLLVVVNGDGDGVVVVVSRSEQEGVSEVLVVNFDGAKLGLGALALEYVSQ